MFSTVYWDRWLCDNSYPIKPFKWSSSYLCEDRELSADPQCYAKNIRKLCHLWHLHFTAVTQDHSALLPIQGCVHTEVSKKYVLSDEEINFYKQNGYLLINKLIDIDTLNKFRIRFIKIASGECDKGFMSVIKEPSLIEKGAEGEDLINKFQDIHFDEVFSTYFEDPKLLDVVSQLIGDNLSVVHSMLINKPPGTGRHPPHQDLYYFPFRPADLILASWTAMDRVTRENGCLYVIPGSHRDHTRIIPHQSPSDSDKFLYHGISDESLAPEENRIHLLMEPGDTVFFHPLLIHGSGPNTSQNYRKSISSHFANGECQYVPVEGTVQEPVAKMVEETLRRKNINLNYTDTWRFKNKLVKGVRSNL
ncbi:probable phytanoyl-CoA dioxygenase [Battus philenor]|uniref:probable phytanoyl-CoA dioxygenase n=1 Tax=Battus philenor TaxID=42288 RepID=UPI0035CF4781